MTNDDVVEWLVQISAHLREQKEMMMRSEEREKAEATSGPPWVDKFNRRLEQTLATGIGTALSQSRALTARGFAGTVEQAQMDYTLQQLSRQFAAVMMPIQQAFVYLAAGIERRMSSMGGTEQNRMMGTLVGAGIGYRMGGPWGAIGGALVGSQMMGERASPYDPYLGAAGGALLGARGGIPGVAIGAGAGWVASRGDYGELRGRGNNMLVSGAGSAFAGLGDAADWVSKNNPFTGPQYYGARALGMATFGDMTRRLMDVGTKDDGRGSLVAGAAGARPTPRRDVTPFSAEQGELGTLHQRIQEGMIRATAGSGFEDAGPLKPLMDLLLDMFDVLRDIAAQAGARPRESRSAEAARG